MRIYSADQSDMVYLSPYTIVRPEEDALHLYSTLFDTAVMLPCSQRQSQRLLALLQQGIAQAELADFFREELPRIPFEALLGDWMRKGVLE